MVFRIICGIMFIICLLSILVQLNDTDGSLWMTIYAFPTLLSGMAVFKKYTVASVLGAVTYTLAFAILMPWGHIDQLGSYVSEVKMTSQESEHSREAIGLLICGVWMTVLAVAWYRNRDDASAAMPAVEE